VDGGSNGGTVCQRRPYNRVILGVWFTTPYMRKLKVKWKFLERATKRLASAKATKKAAGIMWTLEEEEILSKNYKPYKIFLKNTVEKVWRVR